jgi:hypothetical protein
MVSTNAAAVNGENGNLLGSSSTVGGGPRGNNHRNHLEEDMETTRLEDTHV